MKLRSLAASLALVGATLALVPTAAHADDPEFPRNGIIPVGVYQISTAPGNVVGTPLAGCDLHVSGDAVSVRLTCPAFSRDGRQIPVGPDQTYVVLNGIPLGLDLHDIDPRQGQWSGTVNVAATPISVLYELAGIWLQRR